MYKTETVNGEMSFEPENMGMMKEWLKENVKEEKYVVMKAEVEVMEEIMRSKTIKWWIRFARGKGKEHGKWSDREYLSNDAFFLFFFTLSAFFSSILLLEFVLIIL
ncbi:unnamed protein product [Brassica oleracea]